jgi:hypothetical protein
MAATDTHTIIEELLEAVFSVRSAPRLYNEGQLPPGAHLTLNGWNIPFINHVKYLGVVFDKRVTWRLHIGMTEAKAFRTFIRIYSLLKSERLRANIKITLHKALIKSVMTYTCPSWELPADT